MRARQRVFVSVSALVIAVLLHTMLCEWTWKRLYHRETVKPLVYTRFKVQRPEGRYPPTVTYVRGLIAEPRATYGEAVVYGMAVPLGLVVFSITLMWAWRSAARREKGRCPNCGYDLQWRFDDGCPECGWRRAETPRSCRTPNAECSRVCGVVSKLGRSTHRFGISLKERSDGGTWT